MTDQSLWLEASVEQLDRIGLYSTDKIKTIKLSISILALSLYSSSCIFDIKYNCEELVDYTEALSTFLPASASLVFLLCFISNRKKVVCILAMLRKDFTMCKQALDAEEFHLKMVKYSQYYIYFTYFGFILFGIQSYLEKESTNTHDGKNYGMPARIWVPYDLSFWPLYILTYIFEEIAIFVVLHVTIPIAMFFASLLLHLRAQLYYLQHCLQQVCEQTDYDVGRAMLKKCLKLHDLLIEFTEETQSAFSSILFIHNYSASIVISVAGYQATMVSILSPEFLPFFCQVNYVLAECFVYCYYGQQIIDESSFLGFVAYNNKWYNCPNDIGKDLSLIIMRCQRPLKFVFIGSTDSSLETYYNIVKTGYSYFVFLANMNEEEE